MQVSKGPKIAMEVVVFVVPEEFVPTDNVVGVGGPRNVNLALVN